MQCLVDGKLILLQCFPCNFYMSKKNCHFRDYLPYAVAFSALFDLVVSLLIVNVNLNKIHVAVS